MVLSFFNGQAVNGALLGRENQEVMLPEIRAAHVEWSFYWPSFKKQEKEYRFDVTGFSKDKERDGNPELWFVECKYWQSRKPGIPQLEEFLFKKEKFREARQYKGELKCWFCSKNKLNPLEQEFCRNNDIYFSSADEVEQLVCQLRKSQS